MKTLLVIVFVAGAWGRSFQDKIPYPTMEECLAALSTVQFQRKDSGEGANGFLAYCKPDPEAKR